MAPEPEPQAPTLDRLYAKWDGIDVDEDDEDDGRPPQLAPEPLSEAHLAAHRYIDAQMPSVLPAVPPAEREALARLIRATDPRGHPSNVIYCNQICDVLVRDPKLATKATLDRLCALTRALAFSEAATDAPAQLVPILLAAVNCLAACVEVGVINLFSAIATPTGDVAEELRRKYDEQQFGKAYLLDYMGWQSEGVAEPGAGAEHAGWGCVIL